MIYLGFILDYLIALFLPIDSYFIIDNLDKNSLFKIVVIGIILDLLYLNNLFNLIILLIFYISLKIIKVKKKYLFLKRIISFLIYFNLMFFMLGFNTKLYFYQLGISFILQIIYMFYSDWLLN